MREQRGDLWALHRQGHWIGITINGVVNHKGRLVMGAGLAKQARDRFTDLDRLWGDVITRRGLGVIALYPQRLIAFPTKYDWRAPSDITLIRQSAEELMRIRGARDTDIQFDELVYLPRVGCGLGGLDWETQVKPVLDPIFDDRIVIVTP